MREKRKSSFWEHLESTLEQFGVDLDQFGVDLDELGESCKGKGFKVFCGGPLKSSIKEFSKAARDQVVMVRVDDDTNAKLDAWVETGAVKSRSEAAALFIREGLKVHAEELEKLESALKDVEAAKDRLKDKVKEVFGGGQEGKNGGDDDEEPASRHAPA